MTKKIPLIILPIFICTLFNNLHSFSLGNLKFYVTNDFTYRSNVIADKKNQLYELLSIFTNYKNWSFGLTLRGHNFYKQEPHQTLKNLRFDIYRKYTSCRFWFKLRHNRTLSSMGFTHFLGIWAPPFGTHFIRFA